MALPSKPVPPETPEQHFRDGRYPTGLTAAETQRLADLQADLDALEKKIWELVAAAVAVDDLWQRRNDVARTLDTALGTDGWTGDAARATASVLTSAQKEMSSQIDTLIAQGKEQGARVDSLHKDVFEEKTRLENERDARLYEYDVFQRSYNSKLSTYHDQLNAYNQAVARRDRDAQIAANKAAQYRPPTTLAPSYGFPSSSNSWSRS